MTTTTMEPMTSEKLFKMRPSKTVDRWIFRGELRESKMTKRNPSHSNTVSNISFVMDSWLRKQKLPRRRVYSGEAYFRIRMDPDTNVGIDVALSSPQQALKTTKKASFVEGPPIVAVEVLSPYDKQIDISDTIEEYLDCVVKAVWIVNPYDDTIDIHRLNCDPECLNRSDVIENQPEMPGFKCSVAELFM